MIVYWKCSVCWDCKSGTNHCAVFNSFLLTLFTAKGERDHRERIQTLKLLDEPKGWQQFKQFLDGFIPIFLTARYSSGKINSDRQVLETTGLHRSSAPTSFSSFCVMKRLRYVENWKPNKCRQLNTEGVNIFKICGITFIYLDEFIYV